MSAYLDSDSLERLITSLSEVREQAFQLERDFALEVNTAAADYRASARNLLHYVALRRHDLRELQRQLSHRGLSSLGRLEAHTMASLDAVLAMLHQLAGRSGAWTPSDLPVNFTSGPVLLERHADALLGPSAGAHGARIMVTMPSQAATDPTLIRDLMRAGMSVMRINAAHDDAEAWTAMVNNLRRAELELGRGCRVSFDLAGPKLRTGPIEEKAHVFKVKPIRDPWGKLDCCSSAAALAHGHRPRMDSTR